MDEKKDILSKAVNLIRTEVNASEKMLDGSGLVQPGNIAKWESNSGLSTASSQDSVVMTIVNIEEEKTLKNTPPYIRKGDSIEKRNPTLFLNLYVLFSCPADEYLNAVEYISQVIGFFQTKNVFTPENISSGSGNFPKKIEKIVMELVTLNFEQLNHLWGILGGKYMPSVMYKLRLIPVQYSDSAPVELVEEIETQSSLNN